MKLLEIKKGKNSYSVSLFGFPLYNYEMDKQEFFKTFIFFGGLLSLTRDIALHTEKLKFCSVIIYRTRLKYFYKKYFVIGIPVWCRNIGQEFYVEFMDKVLDRGGGFYDFWIFLCRSGEFFLIMHHMKEIMRRKSGRKILFVFTQKYHIDIFRMFFPDENYIYVPRINVPIVSHSVQSMEGTYGDKNVFIPLYERYFVDLEERIRFSDINYYVNMKEWLGIHEKAGHFSLSGAAVSKAEKIAKHILNSRFVFISPESQSNELLEKGFWEELCARIKGMGYEIFCNSMNFNTLIGGTQSAFLNYEEAIALSKHASCIIGMRSGFLECLSQSGIPLVVIYTDFPDRPSFKRLSSDRVLKGFSILPLPHVQQELIFELDANATTVLLNDILSILSKLKIS